MMKILNIAESGHAKGTGKRRRAKLIGADIWGASAYYPGTILERDAGSVFLPGTKIFENHHTDSERLERPEGDVTKLVGKLISYGKYEPDNPEGPGVYADVEFYESYVPRINEIGEDIGLSVIGQGKYIEGEIAGRYGNIITSLERISSVDIVTNAGADGKLLHIIESAKLAGTPITREGEQSVTALTKEDFESGIVQLKESFSEALTKGMESMTMNLKEALVPTQPEQVTTTEPDAAATIEVVEAATIDQEELATKFAEAALPPVVMGAVILDLKEGKPIDEAIEKQIKIREAYTSEVQHSKTLHIVEANKDEHVTDLRASILNTMKGKVA